MSEGIKRMLVAAGVIASGYLGGEGVGETRGRHGDKTVSKEEVDPDAEIVDDDTADTVVVDAERFMDEDSVEDHPTLDPELINKSGDRVKEYEQDRLRAFLRYRYGSAKIAEKYFTEDINPVFRDKVFRVVLKYTTEMNKDLPIGLEITPVKMMAVIMMESNFKMHQKSKAGAQGLCQVLPASAERVGVHTHDKKGLLIINDIDTNIEAGVKILAYFIKYFGSIDLGLVAYAEGNGNLLRNLDEVYGSENLKIQKGKRNIWDMKKIRELISSGKINWREVLSYYVRKPEINKKTVEPLLYPAKVQLLEKMLMELWGDGLPLN